MKKKLLYIAPALPVLTCTFIYREIFDLRDLGFRVDTVSMNTPPSERVSEEAQPLLYSTLYLDRVRGSTKVAASVKILLKQPGAVLRCLNLFCRAKPMQSFRDWQRLAYHLLEACYLAHVLGDDKPDHIHSHFVTGATSIAMFVSVLLQRPFSFTMHASAIWIDPIALKSKLEACRFCISISAFNKRYVLSKYGRHHEDKIHVVHCGISLAELKPVARVSTPDSAPLRVLSVGQLMKRKGFHVLIEAAKILRDRKLELQWTVVGEGNQRPALEKMLEDYNLQKTVVLIGARPHEEIAQFAANADIFTLPCVIGDDNTRDGIPVALMEAMAWRLPVVSTNIVGLPELIDSGRDGLLVESANAEALADAIQSLAGSRALRQKLGNAGYDKIEREFNSARSARQLAELFAAPANAHTTEPAPSTAAGSVE